MDHLTKIGEVLLGWAALSVFVAVGWSCFKAHVRVKQQQVALDLQRRAWRVQRERVRLNRAS
jgi:hypothetical protein